MFDLPLQQNLTLDEGNDHGPSYQFFPISQEQPYDSSDKEIEVDLEQGSNTGDHDNSHHVSHGDYSCYMIKKKKKIQVEICFLCI